MTTPPTKQEAWDCAAAFLRMTEIAAVGDATQTADALRDYLTDDPQTMHRNTWALASVGPVIVGHALRTLYGDTLCENDIFVIAKQADTPEQADAHALTMMQAVVQHASDPQGGGTDYATDIVAAHFHNHGPDGMFRFLAELVSLSAFLWQQGAYKPDTSQRSR